MSDRVTGYVDRDSLEMKYEGSFGNWLKRRRGGLGFTQANLGRLAGYSGETIRKVEAGERRPTQQMAEKLAQALEIELANRAAFVRFARGEPDAEAFDLPPWTAAAGPPGSPGPRRALPVQPTPFMGREREVEAVVDLLLRDGVRLVTLTGPGGTGKTRLGLQAAAALVASFADGVYFVDLASVRDPSLVLSEIAQTLELRASGDTAPGDLVRDYLREKQVLLLLDNFEHLAPAASVVAELLTGAPALKVLVTSRIVLRLRAEHEWAVPPLALPDPRHLPSLDRLLQNEAIRLFVERARAVRPDFTLTDDNAAAVVQICYRLDGLPLAIELAAARLRLLSPQAMLAHLETRLPLLMDGVRDRPLRQQTLRGAIGWSYDLLGEQEKRFFRCLAVFQGGCTLRACQAVCQPGGGLPALDFLQSLIEQSMIRVHEGTGDEPRYAMLETIREYGLEQLAAGGETETARLRHAEFFLGLAEEAEPKLQGAEQLAWADRLEMDYANLRAALDWFSGRPDDAEARLRLAAALAPCWALPGYPAAAIHWLEAALARPEASAPTKGRVRALLAAAEANAWSGAHRRAQALAEEALALAIGSRRGATAPDSCAHVRRHIWPVRPDAGCHSCPTRERPVRLAFWRRENHGPGGHARPGT